MNLCQCVTTPNDRACVPVSPGGGVPTTHCEHPGAGVAWPGGRARSPNRSARRPWTEEGCAMPDAIATGSVHHLRLTVTDVDRARDFYTQVLGFAVVMDLHPGYFLSNGSVGLGLGPHPDPANAAPADLFNE